MKFPEATWGETGVRDYVAVFNRIRQLQIEISAARPADADWALTEPLSVRRAHHGRESLPLRPSVSARYYGADNLLRVAAHVLEGVERDPQGHFPYLERKLNQALAAHGLVVERFEDDGAQARSVIARRLIPGAVDGALPPGPDWGDLSAGLGIPVENLGHPSIVEYVTFSKRLRDLVHDLASFDLRDGEEPAGPRPIDRTRSTYHGSLRFPRATIEYHAVESRPRLPRAWKAERVKRLDMALQPVRAASLMLGSGLGRSEHARDVLKRLLAPALRGYGLRIVDAKSDPPPRRR